jgi:NodT family efflux transporter outer membrane factor (OMF) lipoprotein
MHARIFPLLWMFFLSSCSLSPQNSYLVEQAKPPPRPQNESGTLYLNQLVASPHLDSLIQQAFAANPSLQQTLLTLRVRQAQYKQIQGTRMPDIEADFTGSKEENSSSVYSGSIGVSWELDLWQKLADESRAALTDVAQQQALFQSARDTLAAEVMKSWLSIIAAQHAIDIQQQRVNTLQQNEQFILLRYRNGLGSAEDLHSARSSASSAQATLVSFRESLALQQRSLQALLGQTPDTQTSLNQALSATGNLHRYPPIKLALVDMPQQTLQRRPDLQAAYLAIEAADLRTAAAYKDLLPSINLQAALQDVASSPRAALLTDPLWSLLGQLTAPLYQGGQRKAAANIADLNTAIAYQQYRDTLLTAVNEVEDTLGQEQSLAQQQHHIDIALNNARNNLTQYKAGYRTGLVSILELLIVEQNTYDLEAQLDTLTYQRLSNRIDLGLALGLGVGIGHD